MARLKRMRLSVAALAAALCLGGTPAAADDFQLTIRDGRVTLVADNMPVWQILAEWARVGDSQIVNGEKLAGPPVTLRLVDVPEKQALEILLRSASGYMVAMRPVPREDVSLYDRILILPTSHAPAAPPPAAAGQPQPFPSPVEYPVEPIEDDYEPDEAADGPMPMMPGQPPPGTMYPQLPTPAMQPGQMPVQMPVQGPGEMPLQPPVMQPYQPGQMPPGQQTPFLTSPTPGVIVAPPQPEEGQPAGVPVPVRPPQPPPPDDGV